MGITNDQIQKFGFGYRILGRVVPERTKANYFRNLSYFKTSNEEGLYNVVLTESVLMVDLYFDGHKEASVVSQIGRMLAGIFTAEIAFQITAYYHIVLDAIIDISTGNKFNVGVSEPIHRGNNPQFLFKAIQDHSPISEYAQDWRLNRAMRLATLAIEMAYDTPVICRMAVEFIARNIDQEISSIQPNDKINWHFIQQGLFVKEETLKSFYNLSADVRHGHTVETDWEQRKQILEITWEIIYRYNLYLKNELNQANPPYF